MSFARKVTRPLVAKGAAWAGKRLLTRVQKRSAKSVTSKGGRSIRRRGLTGLLFAVMSAAAIAALKVGIDHAMTDRKGKHNSEFDVFDDDEN